MSSPEPSLPPMQAQAVEAQAAHEDTLLAKNNVVGVGVGYKESNGVLTDEVAVVVLVQTKHPLTALAAGDVIPKQVGGVKTDVIEVGYLQAQQTARDPFRPTIPSGVSIGHYKITAGTLGTLVKDRRTGDALILSNNHVLANSNDGVIGDAVLQPGPLDGGKQPADVVAHLERFVRLRYTDETDTSQPPVVQPPTTNPPTTPAQPPPSTANGCDILSLLIAIINALAALLGSQQRVSSSQSSQTTAGSQSAQAQAADAPATTPAVPTVGTAQAVPTNAVDCAVARPVNPSMFVDEIRQIGVVNQTKAPVLGMKVRKYGRTTEYTEGTITLMNATVDIAYSTAAGQKTARFTGQVITTAMSQGGDSGSLIVDVAENSAVGLLFAGSAQATIFTPIDTVLSALDLVI
ncbi:MAG: hypothetical protein U0670_03040 [Anaerolineae bacterium]